MQFKQFFYSFYIWITTRLKNFIKQCQHKYNIYKDKLVSIHILLRNTTEAKMYANWKTTDRNLYSMFFGWLLENLMYGLIISISLITFGIQFKWQMSLTLAALYWVCLDTIKRATETIRNK